MVVVNIAALVMGALCFVGELRWVMVAWTAAQILVSAYDFVRSANEAYPRWYKFGERRGEQTLPVYSTQGDLGIAMRGVRSLAIAPRTSSGTSATPAPAQVTERRIPG